MTNLENVKDFIRTANREELSEIRKVFNTAFRIIQQEEKNQFQKGDIVTINHKNYDSSIIYEVVRVNQKTLTINNNAFGTLKAAPNLLQKATTESFAKLN